MREDPIQLEDPTDDGGANHVSLIQAKKNFLEFGACEYEMIIHVRKPNIEELTGID